MNQDFSANFLITVAIPSPLRQVFSYSHSEPVAAGTRVSLRFANRAMVALVLSSEPLNDDNRPSFKLSPVLAVLDDEPCLPSPLTALLNWASEYYQHPIGEVYQSALPSLLRGAQSLAELSQKFERIAYDLADDFKPASLRKNARAQHAIIDAIEQYNPLPDSLINSLGLKRSALKTLLAKALIVGKPLAIDTSVNIAKEKPVLNAEQAQVLEQFKQHDSQFATLLIDGITGSGKTEVYLRCMEQVLEAGKQVLVLVPEIGLTPQTVQRFMARFQCNIALLHSGLNDTERLQHYLAARSGEARIIIGTRSAIFTPMAQLGLIILDEEHDLSFKQQDGFRYHARDLAVMRGHQADIPVLLGSATPSLESLNNAHAAKYIHCKLTQRAGDARLPTLRLLDVKGQPLYEGLSDHALLRINETLERGEQVLIFINRRGFSHSVLCHDCGWQSECHACSSKLTVHLNANHLRCHQCQSVSPIPVQCPVCNSERLVFNGVGTQRLEQYLSGIYPDTPIFRIDRDSTSRKDSFEQQLLEVQQVQSGILIGTQMLAKGHHLPNVTLVIVLDADAALASTDYRASERLGQLLTQVVGRAGREEKQGLALIQTHYADHPLLHTLLYQGYAAMAEGILEERRNLMLPPFSFQAMLRLEDKQEQDASEALEALRQFCVEQSLPLFAIGPFPAPLQRRKGYFRYQLLLQASHRADLSQGLKLLLAYAPSVLKSRQRFSLDVDPQDMA